MLARAFVPVRIVPGGIAAVTERAAADEHIAQESDIKQQLQRPCSSRPLCVRTPGSNLSIARVAEAPQITASN